MRKLLLWAVVAGGLLGISPHLVCARYGHGAGLGEPVTQGLLHVDKDGTWNLTKVVWKAC